MKFYLCYPYMLFKKRDQQKSYAPLPARLTYNSLYNLKQIFMRINLVLFFIAIAMFKVTASVNAQTINLKFENAPIEKVFSAIEKQTTYIFWYDKALLKNAGKVNLKITNGNLKDALDQCFKDQPLEYQIVENTIVVKAKEKQIKKPVTDFFKSLNISGKVQDENGQPLPGAAIKVKGTQLIATTNNDGNFTIINAPDNAVLIISYIGFEIKEITATSAMTISLARSISKLDEVQVMAYGTTTQRLNTGSIVRVSADDIAKQPVGNPLSALQGRVAGLTVTPSTGLAGSAIRIELRGQNSLATSGGSTARDINSDPLIIIDGIPYAPNNVSLNRLGSAIVGGTTNGGLSPLNSINPSDIESIEILKDADATAIYGSRGGNGVILISTKKGKPGKTTLNANIYSGISEAIKVPKLVNTAQYLEVRNEALKNDGIMPTVTNAYDLKVWDQGKYTNFPEYLIGGNANTSDVQLSLNGGTSQTSFLLSAGFHKENTIFPSSYGDTRVSFHLNVNNESLNKKFKTLLTASYSNDVNKVISANLTSQILSEPNRPDFVDNNGDLIWSYKGSRIGNPAASLRQPYTAKVNSLIGNLQLNYEIFTGFNLKTNLGFNRVTNDELTKAPASASDPQFNPLGTALFGNNEFNGWNIEPQIDYQLKILKGKLSLLAGATWQSNDNKGYNITATGYANDTQLGSLSGASTFTTSDSFYQYKYHAIFGRINYNWLDKYILNLTARSDGSSRFGTDKQFGNFGALGAAWIFSNEKFASGFASILSYGKLRGSYGITGTDQIGNYQFLDSWSNTAFTYQGTTGIYPTRLANDDYSWEKNKKAEIALELGFLKDRIFLSSAYFRNLSDNHLVSYPMPTQTGFGSVTRNFPAVIVNSGWEFMITSKNFVSTSFSWSTSGNISFTKNLLKSFPNIEQSSYSSIYQVGESLDLIRGYDYVGVNPQTGLFQFRDLDGNGLYNSNDYVNIGNFNPKFFGGINNSYTFENWQLDFFVEFKKQTARNFLTSYYSTTSPGELFKSAIPEELLNRWQKDGDIAKYQKFTTTNIGSAFFTPYNSLTISDASYLRLKTLALNYSLPKSWINKAKIQSCRIYIQGQNLFTVTGYKVTDPETQLITVLPPMTTIVAGIQITL